MSRTTRVAILVQVLAGLLVVGACATTGSQPPADDVPTPSGARGDGDAVAPAAFVDREPLDLCGDVRLDQGESVPDDLFRCLDAAAATGAELVVTMPTTEGDPIVSYYRVGPRIDGVEIFVDATRDAYGPREWAHLLCPDATSAAAPGTCQEA
ncbi:hypothetical protein [Cellulosimicrobium sp. 22601]|uniref:hypothetical protein n=1 Tax=unclassified Cellulosimicrobium TaxID=2624466 RepID=UPI003F86B15F